MNKIVSLFQKIIGAEPKPPAPRLTLPIAASPRQIHGGVGREEWLLDQGAFLSDYYRYLRTRIPMIADGVAVWIDLSTSGSSVSLKGGTEADQKEAKAILDALDYRVYEFDYEWGAGFNRLAELFYLYFYTNGRFAAEIIPYSDLNGIAYIGIIDPFTLRVRREQDNYVMYQQVGGVSHISQPLPKDRIFYAAFDPDAKNPMGTSPLDCIKWVVEIKEKLIEDMAKASHNAGFPRLKISITPPIQLPGETINDYVNRANKEFDDTVEEFRDLAPEDNLSSWSNVQIDYLAAAGGQDFQWSINLDRIEGEIVAGLRLFPWVLGSSASTTKNWVEAQHDILMQRVGRGVQHGIRFLNWIRNTELRLRGLPVRAQQEFKPRRDPGKLIEERSKDWEFRRIDSMVNRGYISKDDGARELGLDNAFAPDLQVPQARVG